MAPLITPAINIFNKGKYAYNQRQQQNQESLSAVGSAHSTNSQSNPFNDQYHIPPYQPPAGPPPGRSAYGNEKGPGRGNPYDDAEAGPSRPRGEDEDEDSGDDNELPPYTPSSTLSRPRSTSNLPSSAQQKQYHYQPQQMQQYLTPQNQGFLADPCQQQQQLPQGRRSMDSRGYAQYGGYDRDYNGQIGGSYRSPISGPYPPQMGYLPPPPPMDYAYDDSDYGRCGRRHHGRRGRHGGRRRIGPLGAFLIADALF